MSEFWGLKGAFSSGFLVPFGRLFIIVAIVCSRFLILQTGQILYLHTHPSKQEERKKKERKKEIHTNITVTVQLPRA
jgi:hypothetical protein